MGNVHVQNLKGEKFDTELLYWDQNKKRVYSDRRVRIEQPDQVIYAIGFESNEQLTKYRFFKTEGIFYVDEDSAAPSDTLRTDSIRWYNGYYYLFVDNHGFLGLLFGYGDCFRVVE